MPPVTLLQQFPAGHSCSVCGTRVTPAADIDGLCPTCLLTSVLEQTHDAADNGDASPVAITPGSRLGPFRIVDMLGRGGMSAVYAAHDEHLDREVALKVLPPELLHDETFTRRFQREARVVAGLEHPNIVQIYGSGIDCGIAWMSMRLLVGGTVGDLLAREGRLSVRRVIQILRDVAGALDYAHERRVVHRDIKPTNILLDKDGRACVGDFGLAHGMPGQRSLTVGTVAGTPEYMAPEQAEGKQVDHRCDIYSLGVVAYEMLTGHMLFCTDDTLATLLKHVYARVPVPSRSEVPRSLFAPVQQALAKRPEDRWPSATSFVDALERGLDSTVEPSDRLARAAWAAAASGLAAIALFATIRLSENARSVSPAAVEIASPVPAPLIATLIAPPSNSPSQSGPAQSIFFRSQSAPVARRIVAGPHIEALEPTAEAPGVDDRAPDVQAPSEVPPGERVKGENVATAADTSMAVNDVTLAPPEMAPVETSEVVIPPVRIATVQPTYPPVALSAGIEGDVVLVAVVTTDGALTSVEVLRSAHPLLDDAAKRAVARYRYRPALRDGAPVSFRVQIPVSFRLQ